MLRLKSIREEREKTQKELAAYLHVKQNTYSQYETEQRQVPISVLIQLSEFYDVSVDYILGITDYEMRYPSLK